MLSKNLETIFLISSQFAAVVPYSPTIPRPSKVSPYQQLPGIHNKIIPSTNNPTDKAKIAPQLSSKKSETVFLISSQLITAGIVTCAAPVAIIFSPNFQVATPVNRTNIPNIIRTVPTSAIISKIKSVTLSFSEKRPSSCSSYSVIAPDATMPNPYFQYFFVNNNNVPRPSKAAPVTRPIRRSFLFSSSPNLSTFSSAPFSKT